MTGGALLALAACVGCGTAEYEKRLGQAVQSARQDSVFSQMHAPVMLAGTTIRVQVSQNLEATPLADGTDPRRLKPPMIEGSEMLTDRKLTFEGFQQYQGGKMAFYCYLAASDMSAMAGRDPVRTLIGQIRRLYPAWNAQPETVQCVSLDGTGQEWQRLRATGQQEFYDVADGGQESYKPTEGVLDAYGRQVGNTWVTILWRVPAVYEQNIGLGEWAPRVAGSVVSQ